MDNNTKINLDQEVSLVVRLLPQGDEVDLDLPLGATGKEIIESLLNEPDLGIPRTDPEGQNYTYKLVCKESGVRVADGMTLADANVRDKNTLLLMPHLVAG